VRNRSRDLCWNKSVDTYLTGVADNAQGCSSVSGARYQLQAWTSGRITLRAKAAYHSQSHTFTRDFTFLAGSKMATDAPPAERRRGILLMNQHAWWLVTFRTKGNSQLVGRGTVLHCVWEFEHGYVRCRGHMSTTIRLLSVTVGSQCVTSLCGILQRKRIFCLTPMWDTDLIESVAEI
jgi:hypothetical protein